MTVVELAPDACETCFGGVLVYCPVCGGDHEQDCAACHGTRYAGCSDCDAGQWWQTNVIVLVPMLAEVEPSKLVACCDAITTEALTVAGEAISASIEQLCVGERLDTLKALARRARFKKVSFSAGYLKRAEQMAADCGDDTDAFDALTEYTHEIRGALVSLARCVENDFEIGTLSLLGLLSLLLQNTVGIYFARLRRADPGGYEETLIANAWVQIGCTFSIALFSDRVGRDPLRGYGNFPGESERDICLVQARAIRALI